MDNLNVLNCEICEDILTNPLECENCHFCFCRKCKEEKCQKCKHKNFIENNGLKKILEQVNFPCQNNCGKIFKTRNQLKKHYLFCKGGQSKCVLCNQNFNCFDFLEHVIQMHKNNIVELFDKNSLLNKSGKGLFYLVNKEKKSDTYSFNDKYYLQENQINNHNSNKNNNNEDVKSIDILVNSDLNNLKLGKTKEINQVYETNDPLKLNNLYYCGSSKLTCNCCSDKKCRSGNCFCVDCMIKNIQKKKIKKGKLINKKGIIASKYKEKYFCGINFICKTENFNEKRNETIKCQYNKCCKECADLTANCKIYEDRLNEIFL